MNMWIKVAAALLCVAPTSAWAANCATVSFSPSTPVIPTWNPINPAAQTASFTATIVRTSNASRSARLIFVDTNNATTPVRVGAAGPQYTIQNLGASTTVSFPQNTSVVGQTVATTDLPSGATGNSVTVNLQVTIPANTGGEDFVGGTAFSETINYSVQCFLNGGGANGTDALVAGPTLSLTIPRLLAVTTASPQTIDFGNFTTTTQNLAIALKSTSSVNVLVSTANSSRMVLSGAVSPFPSNATIPYAMTLNSVALNAAGTTNLSRAGVSGANWPLVLSLPGGLPTGKVAGAYADTITLTLTPGS